MHLTENTENAALIRQQAEEILGTMSIEQKVYQMFIVTPEALTDGITVTTADEIVRGFLKERPVGGVVYFSQNLTDTEQTEKITASNARIRTGSGRFAAVSMCR